MRFEERSNLDELIMSIDISRRGVLAGLALSGLGLQYSRALALSRNSRAAAAFNGGRSQINMNFLQGGGEFPFLNHLKCAQEWSYSGGQFAHGLVDPQVLDESGYPKVITAGSGGYYSGNCMIPSRRERPGKYVFLWRCNGSSTVRSLGKILSGSPSQDNGADGRFVFAPTDSSLSPGAVTMSGGYVYDMAIVHEEDEDDYLKGVIFNRKFLQILREANFGVIRFLNWQVGNGGNVTTWATRKPANYFSYQADEFRPSLNAGQTTSGGTAYDYKIKFRAGGPMDKQTIHLNFHANSNLSSKKGVFAIGTPAIVKCPGHGLSVGDPIAVFKIAANLPSTVNQSVNYYVLASGFTADSFQFSASRGGAPVANTEVATDIGVTRLCTLNLNETGAVPIRTDTLDPATDDNAPCATQTLNGVDSGKPVYGTAVYDADAGSWMLFGARQIFSSGIKNGVPYELMVALCAELGAHPYFVAPHLAVDPMTDFHTQLATHIKDGGPSWMVPRFEGCNETWNFSAGFSQTRYAWGKSYFHWGPAAGNFNVNDWYGKTLSTIGQAVNAVYGGAVDGKRYQILAGVQTIPFFNSRNDPASRLTADLYVRQKSAAQSGYVQSVAKNWTTHVCCAQYFTPSQRGTPAETNVAAAYSAAIDNPALQNQIAIAYAATSGGPISDGRTSNFNLAYVRRCYQNTYIWASSHSTKDGVKLKMCGYEGGYSPDLDSTEQINALRNASKFVADVGVAINGGILTTSESVNGTYNDFIAAGGEFPSCFQLAGTRNIWSVLDPSIYASPRPAQWNAIAAFNKEAK